MSDRDQNIQRIRFHIESNQFPEALLQLRRILEENPEDVEILFLLGLCLAEISEYKEAEQHLQHALSLNPTDDNIRELLDYVQQKWAGKDVDLPLSSEKNFAEPLPQLKKKICPNCDKSIDVSSWQCGHCGHIFYVRIAVLLSIFFIIACLLIGVLQTWYARFMGLEFREAVVVNQGGENGKSIQVTDTQWNSIGLGLSRRYTGFLQGKIKNIGDRTIEKATLVIFLQFNNKQVISHIWFDVYDWSPGVELTFELPGIEIPSRAERCEMQVGDVSFYAREPDQLIQPSIWFPQSGHFNAYRFLMGKTQIAERNYDWYNPPPAWSFQLFLQTFLEIIPGFLFHFVCVFLAVILTNICDSERTWNQEWKMDLAASCFVVICFVVINAYVMIVSRVVSFIPLAYAILNLAGFLAKLFLLHRFLGRSMGFSFLIVVFYICLVLSGMGIWYNTFGESPHSKVPNAAQYEFLMDEMRKKN